MTAVLHSPFPPVCGQIRQTMVEISGLPGTSLVWKLWIISPDEVSCAIKTMITPVLRHVHTVYCSLICEYSCLCNAFFCTAWLFTCILIIPVHISPHFQIKIVFGSPQTRQRDFLGRWNRSKENAVMESTGSGQCYGGFHFFTCLLEAHLYEWTVSWSPQIS